MTDRQETAESFRELLLQCFGERQAAENEIADALRVLAERGYHADLGFRTIDEFLSAAPPDGGLGIDPVSLEPREETKYSLVAAMNNARDDRRDRSFQGDLITR